MLVDDYNIKKALVTVIIEKVLLGLGPPVLEEVSRRLFEEYFCYIPDCYEKPEYLKEVLKELYGKSHSEIVNSIQEQLKDFAYNKRVDEFLQVLAE